MNKLLSAFFAGALFASGLVLSGMTQPQRVQAFLDVTGNWDPTLAFVMIGALLVYAPLYRVILRKRPQQTLSVVGAARAIDARLIGGAALFGVGWGIAGMCPGPAIVVASTAQGALVFVLGMVSGLLPLVVRSRRVKSELVTGQ
jgi:uncharacterized membrane protein YedE/YeeE